MVYGAILMVFLGLLTNLFSSLIEMQLSSQSHSSLAQDGRYIYSRMSYDLGRASSISVPIGLATSSAILQLTINGSLHTYALNGTNLEVTNPLGTLQLNSVDSAVSNISFQRLGNDGGKQSIRFRFTLDSLIERTQGTESRSFQTTFALR
jgi:hypothetical protein